MEFTGILRGLFGLVLLIGIAYLFSNNKKSINWKLVRNGLLIQLTIAIFVIKGQELGEVFLPLGWPKVVFGWISHLFVAIINFTAEGAQFIFGVLAISPGNENSLGSIFAFQVLPILIFFASLTSILYYLGIMQMIVKGMAWVMERLMGISGAESLSCSANVFIGQTEAPLMVKPFIKGMTKSELLTIMTGGMATIAGSVMGAYIQILGTSYAESLGVSLYEAKLIFANHLLGASVMAAPAAIVISKIIFPETKEPETKGNVKIKVEKQASNLIEAAAIGAGDGVKLAINVAAMLIAFIALIAMLNSILGWFGDSVGINDYLLTTYGEPLSMQILFGSVLQFLAYGIGVPWESALQFGGLLGTKVALNEFVAYSEMGNAIEAGEFINEKAIYMATYALCGFANLSSIAIQIGGLTPLAPERRSDLSNLGIRAVLGGTLATLLTAALAGIFF